MIFLWRVPFYLRQVVGQFGYGETDLPVVVLAAWYVLVLALVVPCLAYARRRFTVVVTLLGLAALGVLVALELEYVPRVGWFAQGRYAMPALVGVVLCACAAPRFEQLLTARGRLRGYTRIIVGTTAALHLFALVRVMTRFQAGPGAPLDPFRGTWLPQAGPIAPLLAMFSGVALLVMLVGRIGERRPRVTLATGPAVRPAFPTS